MRYTDGQPIELGDVVRIARDYRGVVVACYRAELEDVTVPLTHTTRPNGPNIGANPMSVQRIADECWNGAGSLELCVLPCTTHEFEQSWGIQFSEDNEPGLGLCRYAVLRIGGTMYLAMAHPGGPPGAERMALQVVESSDDTRRDLDIALAQLGVAETDLLWVQPYLGSPRWQLWRVDDNGNEFEVARFQSESYAKWIRSKYEAKGHKQFYFVRAAVADVAG